ncbi:MAG: CDP-alcohol phosphatidyltransferase family protein, partial [Chloroflexota bacterium]
MLDSVTRVAKESVLNPIAEVFKTVHPNTITVVSIFPGILAAWFAYQNMIGFSVAMWALNRILDGLDGTIARNFGLQTDFGGYLDILIDFMIYALIPIGLVLGRPDPVNWVMLAILLMIYYINGASWMYLSAILEKKSAGAKKNREMTSVTMPTGIIEGTETVIAYFVFLLLPQFSAILFGVFATLVLLTIIQRLVWAKQNI